MKIEGYSLNIKEERLKKACRDFEAIFVSKLFNGLRKTIDKSDFTGTREEELFTEMLYDEYAKKINLGIGEMMYRKIKATIG